MKKTIKSTAILNHGVEMPYLGLGTWQAWGRECEQAVKFALRNGYDHIDTAQGYDNERQVGNGWKASGRPREEIFITTKINNSHQGYQKSKRSFKKSLRDLQTDYVDLLLIHWPNISDFQRTIDTWQALVDIQAEGHCRSIGVSNFTTPLIEQLLSKIDVVPAVNQVEFHTFLYQKQLLEDCRARGIQVEAYSPIAKAQRFDHEDLQQVAKKYEKSPAQVMLAWCVNHDVVVIPKSVNESRIIENTEIFFELDDDDLQILDNLQPQTRLVKGAGSPPSWEN
jgi:diketogulonate reductase-like aldo/keto reductase